ncbi:PAS domain S-box protein [Flavobacterium nackdongense]|uniref:histidine kinase n=1 Tax=Flavobacterium nackdongense TaxID=2547394 RepID=A0A4P6Y7F4_9FLAO|nr:PAS domain S-box protein [Flavobacterium nackdongense]QBN17518.1 PAS domain S-box protein [Flavobacterium nackdongense]
MDFHKLLQKQLKKYLTADCLENPSFQAFIQSVNDSYLAFERDKGIMDHTFKESEKEYHEINNQLIKEIELKQLAANNLYNSINKEDLDYDIKYDHNDDLLFVSEYLRAQINKRKQTEEHLHQNNELLKTLLSNFQSGIMAEDENRKMIFANQMYCDMRNIKLPPEELVGIDCSDLIHESKLIFKSPQHFIDKTNKTLKDRKLILGELLETADHHFVERDYIPIFIDNEYKGHLWKYTDVTTKIQTLELLKQSEEHNRLIMNSSLNSIVTIDISKKITFWNRQAEAIFGWKKEEVIGKKMVDLLIPSQYRAMWNTIIDQYQKDKGDFYLNKQLELILINKAGNEFYGEASIIPIKQNGEIFFCAFIQDISKRKQAEKNLLQTVELLKTLLANLQSGVLVEDEHRKILFTNQLFCDVFSIPVPPEKMIGIDCTNSAEQSKELFKDAASFSPRINQILNQKKAVTDELLETIDNRFLARDYVPIFINEEYRGHLWKYTDVTQRIQNQKLLEQSEERTQIIMNSALNAIITVDFKGEITFWNDQAEIVFGWKEEEVLGKIFTEFMIPERNKELWNNSIYQYLSEGDNEFLNKQVELFGVKKSGDEFLAEITITPVTQNDETFFCAFLQDISKRKEAENQLFQSENRSKLIMNASLNAIITIDINGIITFWNRQAEIIFGYKTEEVLGKDLSETIIPHQHIEAHRKGMKHYLETGDGPVLNKPLNLTALNRNSVEFPIEMSIIPINESDQVFFCAFIQDVSEKMEAENIRKIQEEKYQNVIAHMNLGLLEVDNNEVIKYVNQSFATISGYEINELIGKNPSELFVFGDNFDTIKNKKELRKQGTSDIYQLPIKNKRGELKWWAISGAPNYDNKGNVIGSIGIHLDITEQKQLEIDLEKEKTKALESSKAKEIFLANMSHEIRTPLNAIIGFLRELEKQELSEIQKKYINNSSIASKHLLAIINNILDISKIEAGEMSLESENFIFEKSITNVATVMHPMLLQKGLDLSISISKKIEKVLIGDALRLQQILFNLVGNSIKFTSKGSIAIHCDLVEDKTLSQKIKISISDTGIGMESSFIDNVFNKFSQEDKAITRKYGGTGLGLSITKELVNLMGGKIEIESEKNSGTTIRIYLKYPKGDILNVEERDSDKPQTRLDNISILLVEDNYLNRMVAQNSLQYFNCNVTEAENGLEAIAILKEREFDIILMDIQMPEMGGIEATEIIRKELKRTTPIVALTANAFKTEIDKCKMAGMDDYVTKPFDEDILIETIAKHTINKKAAIPKAVIPEVFSTDKLYNLTSLHTMSRGNKEFIAKMISIFIEQTTSAVDKATIAMSQDDFHEVSRLIHKIKPSVESLGILSISSEMKLLEKIAKEAKNKKQIAALFSRTKEVLEKAVLQLKDEKF